MEYIMIMIIDMIMDIMCILLTEKDLSKMQFIKWSNNSPSSSKVSQVEIKGVTPFKIQHIFQV
jgi:hypothetical protein